MLAQAHDEGRRLSVDRYAVIRGKKQRRLSVCAQHEIPFSVATVAAVQREDRDSGTGRMDFFHAGPHDAGKKRVAETAEKMGVHGADRGQLP